MDSLVYVLVGIAFCVVSFLALFFYEEGKHWRQEYYALLDKPVVFWQEREIRRQLAESASRQGRTIEQMFQPQGPALKDIPFERKA